MHSVAIAITVYRNPPRLASLLDNMRWAGVPDIPMYVFEDPSPFDDRDEITEAYRKVCEDKGGLLCFTAPQWGCMQGSIDFALSQTREDWIIYVPDDVIFTRGGLWNEYAGVLAYGRDFVGAIQAPYWNAIDLVHMGVMPGREAMYNGNWLPEAIPRNPHWEGAGVPRKYINLNGAGFSISRRLYERMGGWPTVTWRLDEYAGYMAWKLGFVVITLPGPPRIHYFGGTTPLQPPDLKFHTEESWKAATGASPTECGVETALIMNRIVSDNFNGILEHFARGGV